MYHLTENGPRTCNASIGRCPYKTAHFQNFSDAEETYSLQFDLSPQRKLYAPAKSSFTPPSASEAKEVLSSFSDEKPEIKLLTGSLIAHSNFGSIVYNLDNPESDNDLFFMVDKKASHDFQGIDAQKRDVKVSSIFNFAKEYLSGANFNVDILHSGALQMPPDQAWSSYLQNLRFNKYEYLTKLRALTEKFALNAALKHKEPRVARKLIKTALRNEILANRFQREDHVRPVFTATEREGFYRSLDFVNKNYANSNDGLSLIKQASLEVD